MQFKAEATVLYTYCGIESLVGRSDIGEPELPHAVWKSEFASSAITKCQSTKIAPADAPIDRLDDKLRRAQKTSCKLILTRS